MEKKGNKVVRNYIYNTAYQILLLVAPLITTPYVSRVLGATGIGIYNYAQSIATYFIYVGAVGTTIYGQREIAYAQDDPEKRSKIFWEIVSFKFTTVALCTVVYFLVFGLGDTYSTIYRILTLEVVATAFDISWFFMGMENFRVTVIRNTIIKVIGIVLIFLFVKSSDDVAIYTLCLTLPVFLGNISLWFSLPKYLVKTHIHIKGIVRHIRPTLVLFLPQLAIEVYAVLDKTMLGALASDISEVGYYTQASRIVKLTLALVTSLGTVMLPAMSASFAKGDREAIERRIKTSFRFVLMLGSALLFGICGVAKNFVPIFFGPGYEYVTTLIIVICPIILIIAISNVTGKQYLLPTGQEKYYTVSVVAGALVNVILNAILIPRFNAIGASVATVFAELSVTVIQAFAVRKQLPVVRCLLPGIKYVAFGAVMCFTVYEVGELLDGGILTLVVQVITGCLVYGILLILSKEPFLKEGIDMLRDRRKAK